MSRSAAPKRRIPSEGRREAPRVHHEAEGYTASHVRFRSGDEHTATDIDHRAPASRELEVGFDDGANFRIPFELMRVYSPSAEVQGHGPGQEVLQTGKREVEIVALEPVGNYAVQPTFSDGHAPASSRGTTCYFLGSQQDELWRRYDERLAGGRRRPRRADDGRQRRRVRTPPLG